MYIIEPEVHVAKFTVGDINRKMRIIEEAGRVCYKSPVKETIDLKFISDRIKAGHESIIEHVSETVKFIVDRGISHEIVRHRLSSFSQESTRYANYSKDYFRNGITVIRPFFFEGKNYELWEDSCCVAEQIYLNLINFGAKPQEARSVLPNSLKTELYMTANLREWRHFFKMRCAIDAHPQMRQVAIPLFNHFKQIYPAIFFDMEFSVSGNLGDNLAKIKYLI